MKARRAFTAVLLAALTVLAQAQEGLPRITVLPFDALGPSKADAQALTLFFETALQNTGRCQIIEQTEVNKILKNHQYVLNDFNDPSKAVEIGKLLPANHIVLGTIGTLGGKFYINVKIIDLKSGANVAARNATAATLDALTAGFDEMAGQMLGVPASIRPAGRPEAPPGLHFILHKATLRFFENGYETPPLDSRSYAVSFPARAARYIYWELELDLEPPAVPLSYDLEAVFYNPNGSILGKTQSVLALETGWTWVKHCCGWGYPNPNNWRPGRYQVTVYVDSMVIASGFFSVF